MLFRSKDVMLFYEFGIPAIAPNSESTFISESQLNKLSDRFKSIALLYDNDLPGIQSMNKIRKIHNIKCLWLPRDCAKDFSDFYKIFGRKKTEKIINYGKEVIKYGKAKTWSIFQKEGE